MININFSKRRTLAKYGKLLAVFALAKINFNQQLGANQQNPKNIILSIRLWSSSDYSRLIIESSIRLRYKFSVLGSKKIKIEIENAAINESHLTFERKLLWLDPYIQNISNQNQNNNAFLIIEFKELINPQIFENPPISTYQHRLFIDVYPQVEVDPLDILLAENAYLDELEQQNLMIDTEKAIGKSDQQLQKMIDELEYKQKSQSNLDSFIDQQLNLSNVKPKKPKKTQAAVAKSKSIKKRKIVVLDPGHGGEDPGAVGSYKSYEKNIVLAVSKFAKKDLEKFGYLTVLTRDRDFFIPLRKRVIKAQKLKADLFISVHADAFTRKSARGSSVYMLSQKRASSAAAKWLAGKENSSDIIGGIQTRKDPMVAGALKDLVRTRSQNSSLSLARNILKELGKINRLHKKSVERAGFAVLKSPDIPSALVETAFISNPNEESRLNNPDYQKALASAIARGVFRYFTSSV